MNYNKKGGNYTGHGKKKTISNTNINKKMAFEETLQQRKSKKTNYISKGKIF